MTNRKLTKSDIAHAPTSLSRFILNKAAQETILTDARRTYPRECCGVLIGRREETNAVISAHPAENINTSRAHDRYYIDPREILRLDRIAEGLGLEILGFYHSHPDHPARPSPTDAEFAWPGYLYLIVALSAGDNPKLTGWCFDEKIGGFFQQEIISQVME